MGKYEVEHVDEWTGIEVSEDGKVVATISGCTPEFIEDIENIEQD